MICRGDFLVIASALLPFVSADQLAEMAPSFFGGKAAIHLSKDIPQECKLKASTEILTLGAGCMGLDHLFRLGSSIGQANMSLTILESFGSESFVSALCSPRCAAATQVFESELSSACGNSSLLDIAPFNTTMTIPTNGTDANNGTTLSAMTNVTKPINVAYISSFIKSLSAVSCFRINETSKWCANELYDYLNQNNVSLSFEGLSSEFVRNSNVSCSSCMIRTVDAAQAQTSFVEYDAIKPSLDAISNVTKACKPKQVNAAPSIMSSSVALPFVAMVLPYLWL